MVHVGLNEVAFGVAFGQVECRVGLEKNSLLFSHLIIMKRVIFCLLVGALAHTAEHADEQTTIDDASALNEQELAYKQQLEAMKQYKEEQEAIAAITDWKERSRLYFERYSLEIMLTVFFAIGGINYLVGRCINNRKADRWL